MDVKVIHGENPKESRTPHSVTISDDDDDGWYETGGQKSNVSHALTIKQVKLGMKTLGWWEGSVGKCSLASWILYQEPI